MKLWTRRIQELIDAHRRVHTHAACLLEHIRYLKTQFSYFARIFVNFTELKNITITARFHWRKGFSHNTNFQLEKNSDFKQIPWLLGESQISWLFPWPFFPLLFPCFPDPMRTIQCHIEIYRSGPYIKYMYLVNVLKNGSHFCHHIFHINWDCGTTLSHYI